MSKERIYGVWAGNPKGTEENPLRCIKKVLPLSSYIFAQCRRRRGHGPEGLYCKQHAKIIEDKDNG